MRTMLKNHVRNPYNPEYSLCGRFFPEEHERCQEAPTENVCGHCRQSWLFNRCYIEASHRKHGYPTLADIGRKLEKLEELEAQGQF